MEKQNNCVIPQLYTSLHNYALDHFLYEIQNSQGNTVRKPIGLESRVPAARGSRETGIPKVLGICCQPVVHNLAQSSTSRCTQLVNSVRHCAELCTKLCTIKHNSDNAENYKQLCTAVCTILHSTVHNRGQLYTFVPSACVHNSDSVEQLCSTLYAIANNCAKQCAYTIARNHEQM